MRKNCLQSAVSLTFVVSLCLTFMGCPSDPVVTDGNIIGTITNGLTNEPLAGVEVSLVNSTGKSVTTSADGTYRITNLPSGDYTVQVKKANFQTTKKDVFVTAGQDNRLDFMVQPSVTYGNIVGKVISSRTNEPLAGVVVSLLNNTAGSIHTGDDGIYRFTNIPTGDYTVQAQKENYNTEQKQVTVAANKDNQLDFSLQSSTGLLELSQTQLDFGSDKTNLSVSIKNTGNAVLSWQITEDIEWLSCNPSKGLLPKGEQVSVVITVDRSSLTNGEYKQSIAVSSNGGDAVININMVVSGMNDVEISPEALDFGATTTSMELTMKNRTKGSISYTLTPSNSWIVPNKTSGNFTNNEIVTVGVDRTKLGAGDYTGKLSLKVGSQSVDIPVSMTIIQSTPPTVSLYSVDDVTYNTAKFRGAVVSIGSSKVTSHGFCWSTHETPTTSDSKCTLGDIDKAKDYDYIASNLQPSTRYYVRAYAENSVGTAYSSNTLQFVTGDVPQPPSVETGGVSRITTSGAQVSGNIISIGNEAGITQYGHCWNTKSNPTTANSKTELGKADAPGSFTSTLDNLSPGQTYYVRAYATNSIATAYGEEVTFTTLKGDVVLSTKGVTDIRTNQAIGGGVISSTGGNVISERGVCWNTSGNPTVDDNHAVSEDKTSSFSVTVTGLVQQTQYYVRAYVKTDDGKIFYGSQLTFTTNREAQAAQVGQTSVTNIQSVKATLSAAIISTGYGTISDCGFYYATHADVTAQDNKLSCGKKTGTISVVVANLEPATTYYVRAYAVDETGVSLGEEATFTTSDQTDDTGKINREGFGGDEDWN